MQNGTMRVWVLMFMAAAAPVWAAWPQFLGANRDGKGTSAGLETNLLNARWVWTCARGESYSAPSISGGRLFHHTRFQGVEKIECLDSKTGRRVWSDEYTVAYQDRFNYLTGPRASPSIDEGRVYALGVQGMFSCYQANEGKLLWRRDLMKQFDLDTGFFGFASSPLVVADSVVVNLGMGKCVASFDALTGETRWVSGNQWGRSYASPVAATMYGKRIVFVFAGGESNPPVGGLLCLDPGTGRIYDRFAWRSPRELSVNASTPVVEGNRVFISSSYDVGGVMLEVLPDFTFKEIYRTKAYASHWATPILVDGFLYGFANNKLVCMDWQTGERVWRTVPKVGNAEFQSLEGSGRGADRYRPPVGEDGFGIGSLVYAGGHFLCLGENGLLAWMDLSPEGCKILSHVRLFNAGQSWTAPVLDNGLVYICQNLPDLGNSEPRLICIDLTTENENGK